MTYHPPVQRRCGICQELLQGAPRRKVDDEWCHQRCAEGEATLLDHPLDAPPLLDEGLLAEMRPQVAAEIRREM